MASVTAPTTEIGYTQAPQYNWWLYENETTPELVWPQSIYVFDQMRRTDAQVGSVLRAVTETLLRTPWRIDPAGARARVTKFVADDLGLPVVGKPTAPPPRLKDRFSWPTHLREALLMLPYGHAYFEQVYRVTPDGNAAHLRKLAYRPAKTIERIDVAPDGGLVAIKQYWTELDREPKPIPVGRLVAYIHAKEGGNWLGTSILRNCYKNWLLKDRLLRVQAQTVERNGMGVPVYEAQEGATSDDMAAGKAMAAAWRAGEAAGSATPFGAKIRLVGVEGTLPDAQPAIDYHDSQIARAVLAHFLNLGAQTGSWALGTTFADFFTMSLQTLAEQIRDTATQHIVEDLVDINFGEDEPAPRLVFDEIGSRQAATAQALKTLVDAGVIRPDEVLEESSRQQYGLPPADPATLRTPPAPTPGSDQSAPPTQTGDMSVAAAMAAPKDAAAGAVAAKFNPDQLRRPDGEWGTGGAVHDVLKLAERIQLDKDEHFVSSDRISPKGGTDVDTLFAVVDSPRGREIRIGIIPVDDAEKWRAGNRGSTVKLTPSGVGQLHTDLTEANAKAKKTAAKVEAQYAAGEDPPVSLWDNAVAEGTVSGEWGDLAYRVYLTDDEPTSWTTTLEVQPSTGGDGSTFYPKDLRKLIGKLAGFATDPVSAAAGMDTHPGGEQLKHYWVYGEGAAKWSTWTELRDHLLKYLNPEMAKRTAAEWFHLRYGFWPGADVNRVKHGKPPRGHLVGPG